MIYRPIRLLLVEDNPSDAMLMHEALEVHESCRFELTHVDRLDAGLEAVRGGEFDAVLLDLSLPDASGLDTFRAMHNAASHLPIVVLSGLYDEETAVAAVAEGAQDYLIKGQTLPDRLARALLYAVERKRQQEELARRNAQLVEQVSTDVLTGLRNARHLRGALPAAFSLARRTGQPLSLVMLDVDHFKSYNDAFGHPAGDEVLRRVGVILQRMVRAHDLGARYGGEEFAVLLPATDATAAKAFAERVRAAFAGYPWPLRPVTASLGVATSHTGIPDGDALLVEADRALYRAKRAGRDRIAHHDDPLSSDEIASARLVAAEVEEGPGHEPSAVGSATVLHIDNDPAYRDEVARILARAGMTAIGAATAAEGLRRVTEAPDLILLDASLPDPDGLEICHRIKGDPASAAIPVLGLSYTRERGEDLKRDMALGADITLPKTVEPGELLAVIGTLLRAHRAEQEMLRAHVEIDHICDAMIEGWARALELHDHETEGHSRRVADLTVRLARRMGFDEPELAHIRRGALLHDIGKVAIPDTVLDKPGPLDDSEWQLIRQHPEIGYEMLRPIPFLRPALAIPYCHHERWNGTGYPRGLKGEEIPRAARLMAVVDIWDALGHDRPYRAGLPEDRVRECLRALAGTYLDPQAVEEFLAITSG